MMTIKKVNGWFLASLFLVSLSLFSCKEEVKKQPKEEENLVEIVNGEFREYYPGKKHIKFKGRQDKEKRRHGRWVFLGENGDELSVTHYINGKKHGHSIVKYPNGTLRYVGEYNMDEKVGVWQTFKPDGSLDSEINYEEVK